MVQLMQVRWRMKDTILYMCTVLLFPESGRTASIGDGHYSLLTGNPINASSSVGSCIVDGFIYPSETAVPRQHPCHYCICIQGSLQCYIKSCPLPPEGCVTFHSEGHCDPSLYICAIPESLKFSKTGRSIPSVYFPIVYRKKRDAWPGEKLSIFEEDFPMKELVDYVEHKSRAKRSFVDAGTYNHLEDKGCNILGVRYSVGELIGVASDRCLDCRCANQELFCSPKCCFEPAQVNLEPQYADLLSTSSKYIAPNPLQYLRDQLLANRGRRASLSPYRP